MLEYKGYKIRGESIPMYMEGCESHGSVCNPIRNGSIIEVARIEGKIFKTIKEAEAYGLELAREWVESQQPVGSGR
jgi:hypothetical protein